MFTRRYIARSLAVIAGGWVCGGSIAIAQINDPAFRQPRQQISNSSNVAVEPRSVYSRTDRMVDELDRPRYKERSSHRGFEATDAIVSAVSTTSMEEAREASLIVHETWNSMKKTADAFMTSHRHPDFGLGSVQVLIDTEPPRERDIPFIAFNVDADLNRIVLNTAPGRPTFAEQAPLLRAAAVQTFLHVSGLDRQLPDWVCDGWAQSAVLQFDGPKAMQALVDAPPGDPRADQIRNDRWRRFRIAPDRLDTPPPTEATEGPPSAMVAYLLLGEDGRNAPPFLASLHTTLVNKKADHMLRDFDRRNRPTPTEAMPADQWAERRVGAFQQWVQNPDADVPALAYSKNVDAETAKRERELFVILKLAERVATPPKADAPQRFAPKTPFGPTSPDVIKPKVTEFRRDPGPATPASANEPAPVPVTNNARAKIAARIRTASDLFAELDQQGSWAAIDADGGLLLSINRKRIEELTGDGVEPYQSRWDKDRWVWTAALPDGKYLDGWLEPRAKNDPRLVSKFVIRSR